ncbi:unnamed protein product [Adineta ricciae]|uniref:Uncharacterized protein n=1 Tax=Adineta ricciae TaxID=249248 RepID=A0A814PGQ6_ADIRI|nr:unnamed protein product [Adineta ricciae]CAF1667719.1 unnamed protein product [Adineta ricciae]
MDYQLNMKKPSSSPKPTNHFFHGQKQPYQEELAEHSTLSTSTTLLSTYLTADSPWKHPTTVDCLKLDDEHKRQILKFFVFCQYIIPRKPLHLILGDPQKAIT